MGLIDLHLENVEFVFGPRMGLLNSPVGTDDGSKAADSGPAKDGEYGTDGATKQPVGTRASKTATKTLLSLVLLAAIGVGVWLSRRPC